MDRLCPKLFRERVLPSVSIVTGMLLRDAGLILAALVVAVFGFAVGVFAGTFAPASLASMAPWLPFAGAAVALGTLIVALRPKWVFWGLVFFCVLDYEFFEETHLPLGFMKLYIQDAVLVFNLFYLILRLIFGKVRKRSVPLTRFIAAYYVLGAFSLFNGLLLSGNPYDKVFGDFRRTFVYFLNYFFVLYFLDDLPETLRFRRLLVVATSALIVKGLFQAATGQFYYRRMGDAAHILSHFELTFLSLSIFYAIGRVLFTPQTKRWGWGLLAFLGMVITVLGNYRASWLGLAGGLVFIYLFLPVRRRLQMLAIGALLVLLTLGAIYALWDVEVMEHSTLGAEIAAKADVKNAPIDVNVVWRFDSYRAVLEKWRERPWLGCGLGTSVDFQTITTRGTPILAIDHRVHNSFLWLFMTQGLLGFPIAMMPHIAFFVITIRYLRRVSWIEGKVTVLACAAYAVSMLISTAFEHFLESGTTITVYSAVIGLAMLMIHYTPPAVEDPTGARTFRVKTSDRR